MVGSRPSSVVFFARLSSFSRGKVSKISLQSPRNGDATPYGNSNTIQFDFFQNP